MHPSPSVHTSRSPSPAQTIPGGGSDMTPRGVDDPNGSQQQLEAIEVRFLAQRPERKIRLIVQSADGQCIRKTFGEREDIVWRGNMTILTSATIGMEAMVWKRRRLGCRRFATAEAPARASDLLSVSVRDANQKVEFILSFRVPERSLGTTQTGTPLGTDESTLIALRESIVSARSKVHDKSVVLEKLGKARSVISFIKTVGAAVKDIHPAIAGAMVAFNRLSEACEKQEESRESALDLLDDLDIFVEISERIPELHARRSAIAPIRRMLELMEEIVKYICEHTSTQITADLLSREYLSTVSKFKSAFSTAVSNFHQALTVEILRGVDTLQQDNYQRRLMEALDPSLGASHRATRGDACLEGTRISLLQGLMSWLASAGPPQESPNERDAPMLWLNGIAGSGKSTVAKTFARMASRKGYAVLCFFCRRDDLDLSNPRRFFATLAYLLALRHAGYRRALTQLLSDPNNAGIGADTISEQFDVLFRDQLAALADPGEPYTMLVDAVDECGSLPEQEQLARLLVELVRLVPWLRILVTSRVEPRIRAVLTSQGDLCRVIPIGAEAEADADIRLYITNRLSNFSPPIPWSAEMVEALVSRAAGLFIWCTTVFSHLDDSLDPHDALTRLLSNTGQASGRASAEYRDLYALYDQVLDSAIKDRDNLPIVKNVLGLVFISSDTSPLPCDAIATLLECRVKLVRTAVQSLHAVLYEDVPVPGRLHGPIRVHHNSFRDFIWSNMDGTSPSTGWQRLSDLHALVAQRLLKALVKPNVLKFNICDLDGPPVFNSDIKDLRVQISKHVSAVVEYGLLHWVHHLTEAGPISDIPRWEEMLAMVAELVGSVKVLFYLEALSLLGVTVHGARLFFKCTQFFKGISRISQPAADVEVFISSFAGAMQSVAHIYLSAMSWAPAQSYISRIIAPVLQHGSLMRSARDGYWDSSISTTNLGSDVWCVAYSPDGERIACGLENGDIRLLDARTGSVVGQALQGHSLAVYSVAYSPDGSQLASGSGDKSVRLWDTRTGAIIGEPLCGHLAAVYSVTFSPDGTCVASGAGDHTARIWSTRTGDTIAEPLRGHADLVRSVVYSSNGKYIASGSADHTVHVWDAHTGALIHAREPLRGHSGPIGCIAYSPAGTFVASGSYDKTLRIWNAHSGESTRELHGHTNEVYAVAYSPNGRQITSASRDGTVRLWDAQSGQPIGEPLRGHSDAIFAVAFSPDGLRITSASADGTVRIWSVQTATAASDLSMGHSDCVESVACSPNGAQIATGSANHTVCLWDATTGAPVGEPLRGHTDRVRSVAYSPDGRWIVSGSEDGTIRLWDAGTGAMVGEPLRGPSGWVRSVAFSPDSIQLASSSGDNAVRRWNTLTGDAIGEPMEGHSSRVLSVSYSPDGALIASASADKTVRLWNARTGEPMWKLLQGHSEQVWSVAFSPDSKWLASASDDETVRVWEVETGASIGEPLQGHTSFVNSVAYSPDGRYLASASSDGTLRIWDALRGEPIGEPLRGHGDSVVSLTYSPNGLQLISSSFDNTVRIWDVSPPADTHWQQCCSRMNPADGWIRDGDRPLLWVPFKYRDRLRCRNTVVIGRGTRCDTPEVDVEKVWAYAEGRLTWTSIMDNDHVLSTGLNTCTVP